MNPTTPRGAVVIPSGVRRRKGTVETDRPLPEGPPVVGYIVIAALLTVFFLAGVMVGFGIGGVR